jgi:hypothetical protein
MRAQTRGRDIKVAVLEALLILGLSISNVYFEDLFPTPRNAYGYPLCMVPPPCEHDKQWFIRY